jgi:hypothetical protein
VANDGIERIARHRISQASAVASTLVFWHGLSSTHAAPAVLLNQKAVPEGSVVGQLANAPRRRKPRSLWRDQGKMQEARELLASVYGWFTEGFDTLDLKEAKALLEELAL